MSNAIRGVVTVTIATLLIRSGLGQATNEPVVTISGRIVDSGGSPVGELVFELVATHYRRCGFCSANDGGLLYLTFSVTTDRNGRFSATVPADIYDLVGGGFGYFSRPKITSIKRIDGTAGRQLELGDLVNPGILPMPPDLPVSSPINGSITEPLGSILRQQGLLVQTAK